MKKKMTYCRGRCIYTASRARHICMLRDNWPVIDWREPIGLQERLEGRSFHNGVISVMSRDSLKGNEELLSGYFIWKHETRRQQRSRETNFTQVMTLRLDKDTGSTEDL